MATTKNNTQNLGSIYDFLKSLGGLSLLAPIAIILIAIIGEGLLIRYSIEGEGLRYVWWALIVTPLCFILIPAIIAAIVGWLISAAPGGKKPVETIQKFWRAIITMGLTMTLVNVVLTLSLGIVAPRLEHQVGVLSLAIAAALTIAIWSSVYKVDPKWWRKVSFIVPAIFIAMAGLEVLVPNAINRIDNALFVSTTVLDYKKQASSLERSSNESVRTQIAQIGVQNCNNTDPNTWERVATAHEMETSIKNGTCAISEEWLTIWNAGGTFNDLSGITSTITTNSFEFDKATIGIIVLALILGVFAANFIDMNLQRGATWVIIILLTALFSWLLLGAVEWASDNDIGFTQSERIDDVFETDFTSLNFREVLTTTLKPGNYDVRCSTVQNFLVYKGKEVRTDNFCRGINVDRNFSLKADLSSYTNNGYVGGLYYRVGTGHWIPYTKETPGLRILNPTKISFAIHKQELFSAWEGTMDFRIVQYFH